MASPQRTCSGQFRSSGKSPLPRAASLFVCCWVEAPSLQWGLPQALGLGATLSGGRLSQELGGKCL